RCSTLSAPILSSIPFSARSGPISSSSFSNHLSHSGRPGLRSLTARHSHMDGAVRTYSHLNTPNFVRWSVILHDAEQLVGVERILVQPSADELERLFALESLGHLQPVGWSPGVGRSFLGA